MIIIIISFGILVSLISKFLNFLISNMPTAVAPFQGATTGPGGRIRDVQAAGKGSHVIAGTAGYSLGNLFIPGYDLPWEKENENEIHPNDFAKPLEISIEASNGASDYGNVLN